jgi:thiol-disulfide isomerase/thioredoxin
MTEPQGGKPDRTWLYVGLAFIAFWGLYLAFFGPLITSSDAPRLDTPGRSGPAEYGWQLLDLDDAPVAFSRFQGKVVFLNVWATWCGPCVAELPSIAALAADPRLKDVAFVCASTDDSAATVKQFLAGKNWPMTFLRATDMPPVFMTNGIPATFLIAPNGRVAAVEVGSAAWNDPSVVEFLEKLSKERKTSDG